MKTKEVPPVAAPALSPPERHRLLVALVGASQLTSVDTVHIRAERRYNDRLEGDLAVPDSISIDQHIDVRFASKPSATGTSVLVIAAVHWKGPEDQTYAVAGVTLRLAYVFKNLTEAPHPEVLANLANELGLHHAWPFIRERIRTLSGELGLPPFVLPLRPRPNA